MEAASMDVMPTDSLPEPAAESNAPLAPPLSPENGAPREQDDAGGEDSNSMLEEPEKAQDSSQKEDSNKRARKDDGSEPQPKKVKRNQTAFMFFCAAERDQVKQDFPGIHMADQSRMLAQRWKALPTEDKAKYTTLAAEDKERYQREVKEHGGSVADAKGEKKEISLLETVIPVGRVKRTCKLDPDVKNITKEATVLVAKTTELFLATMAEEAYKISALSGRRTLKPEDIRDCVNRLNQFEWLRDDFPRDDKPSK